MIDHQRKIIMVHIPKTGGTSLKYAIWPEEEKTIHEVASRYDKSNWESYFTFAIVRNPYERLASQYVYHVKSNYKGFYLRKHPDLKKLSFEAYLNKFAKNHRYGFEPQLEFITHAQSTVKLDFLGKFETYAKDATQILRKINISVDLPRKNIGIKKDYSDILSPDIKDLIFKYYEADFEAFDYKR